MRYWRAEPKVWEKTDQGPVSEADIAVNDMLQERLCGARPAYGWLSEESPDTAERLQIDQLFIVDPIDGTRAFIAGEKHFSHSLAIVRAGVVVAGVVHVPALAQTYAAEIDGPALLNGDPIQPRHAARIDDANLLMSKAVLTPEHWHGPVPALRRSFRSSIAYRLCLVADGSFDGMINLRDSWEWDIAAGHLIAARAGAMVTDRDGGPILFNTPQAKSAGILAAPPVLHDSLMTRMKR